MTLGELGEEVRELTRKEAEDKKHKVYLHIISTTNGFKNVRHAHDTKYGTGRDGASTIS